MSSNYSQRICPYYIMTSVVPFSGMSGAGSLDRALEVASCKTLIRRGKRVITWHCPPGTRARYVRIQLIQQSFLTLAEVEVIGSWGDFPKRSPVTSIDCGLNVTAATIAPPKRQGDLNEHYRRAVAANPRSALILRECPAYAKSYDRYGFDYHEPLNVLGEPEPTRPDILSLSTLSRSGLGPKAGYLQSNLDPSKPKARESQDRRADLADAVTQLFDYRDRHADDDSDTDPTSPIPGATRATSPSPSRKSVVSAASARVEDEEESVDLEALRRTDDPFGLRKEVKKKMAKKSLKEQRREQREQFKARVGDVGKSPGDRKLGRAGRARTGKTPAGATPTPAPTSPALAKKGSKSSMKKTVVFEATEAMKEMEAAQEVEDQESLAYGDPKYRYFEANDPEPPGKAERAERLRRMREAKAKKLQEEWEDKVYGTFERWLGRDDCMKDPAKNECPLCYQDTRCEVCTFYQRWVIPAARKDFRTVMDEALAEETKLRQKAKKDLAKGKDVHMPAGVLLTRGIEKLAAEKEKGYVRQKKSGWKRMSARFGKRPKSPAADLLKTSPRPPPLEFHDGMPDEKSPVPGSHVLPPANKPQWPKLIVHRSMQLRTVVDFVMAADAAPVAPEKEVVVKRSMGDKMKGAVSGVLKKLGINRDPVERMQAKKKKEKERRKKKLEREKKKAEAIREKELKAKGITLDDEPAEEEVVKEDEIEMEDLDDGEAAKLLAKLEQQDVEGADGETKADAP